MSYEETKKDILAAFHFRHATKVFDPEKKISNEDFQFILETGRLSPSSVGYEPWKFLVVQNRELREKLKQVTLGGQGQIPTASHLVVMLARKNAAYNSEYVQHLLKQVKQMPDDMIEAAMPRYKSFQEVDQRLFESERALFDWAGKQTYLALANMMTAAAQIGIDSCPMEGFDSERMNAMLAEEGLLEDGAFAVSVMAAFGYRAHDPARPKTRRSLEDVVQWID